MVGGVGKVIEAFRKYWSIVKPHWRFLKETLQMGSRIDAEKMINQKLSREEIDPFMIKESTEFLRLSIVNLLCYKYLVCGKYLAWGKEAIYYSRFYILNCLLRLRGFALVHLDFLDDNPLILSIDRTRDNRNYGVQKCGEKGHEKVWKRFSELYPDLMGSSKKSGIKDYEKFEIKERIDWTYDLKYASQTTGKFALEQVDARCRHNFLDPNYGFSCTPDEGRYYQELMARSRNWILSEICYRLLCRNSKEF